MNVLLEMHVSCPSNREVKNTNPRLTDEHLVSSSDRVFLFKEGKTHDTLVSFPKNVIQTDEIEYRRNGSLCNFSDSLSICWNVIGSEMNIALAYPHEQMNDDIEVRFAEVFFNKKKNQVKVNPILKRCLTIPSVSDF